LIFFGQTVVVYQSNNGGLGGPPSVHLQSMHREVQIKHDLITHKCNYILMA